MNKIDLSIPARKANLIAIPIIILSGGLTLVPYWLIHGGLTTGGFFEWFSFIPAFVVGIVLHEGLHGLSWRLFGRIPWEDIRFGIYWKALTPYAHCKVAMAKRTYVIALLMPLLVVGLLPYAIALALGNPWLLWFGVVFTGSAAGDVLVFWLIRRLAPETLVQDHPSRVGCYALLEEMARTEQGIS